MRLTSALASDAAGGQGVLEPILCALRAGASVAAPAATVRVTLDDNLDVRHALQAGGLRGKVLVVAGGSRSRAACMGGNVARELADAGVVAVVTDAPVRDSAEIAALGLAVWSRGLTPIRPGKSGGGEVGGQVELAGVRVRPGDWVIADDDGIVVWPQERLDELTSRASALQDEV
ncbi:MAG TPA: RraA family protein [Candidatus Dormibacteraeota bacterium]|nr:RraA family protein [Candidatus Dormibacteraeota bacterium]